MSGRRSSGEIVRLEEYQVERATVDYPADEPSGPVSRTAPTKIGHYTILDLLGVGGMGVVCTAYDPKLDRKVALKLLRKRPKDDGRNSTGQARLVREAQALAKLTHPNIVTVHDVDKVDGQIYMAMEYVDGMSLDKWMVRGERQWREVVQVFVHAARGLAAAHAAGITHRDFKPANVLIGKDGRVLVVDFGLAKSQDQEDRRSVDFGPATVEPPDPAELLRERGSLMDVIGSTQDTKLTQVGRTVGTPAYMAPEQFLGLTVGPDTDQFSFGVALFEALYGYLPFPDDDREELIERVTEGHVSEPPKDTPVPSWVHRVVLRALMKRSEDRFPNMDALIAALQADPAKRRRRALLALGGVALVGMAAYGVAQGIASEDDTCTGASERMEEIWSEGRRAEVQAAFEATALPYAQDAWLGVDKELGLRADAWVDHHTEVCRATNVRKEQSSRLMDVRMACLERRRGEMRALVEVFVSPDDSVVLQAVRAVQSLEDSERCMTEMEGTGLVVEPLHRQQADEIERLLARSLANQFSGSPERAVEIAASALRSARSLGNRTILARAAMRHARLNADRTDDLEAAAAALVEAIGLAAETDQPKLEALGWSALVEVEGSKRGHMETGLAMRKPAEVALRQLQDRELEAILLQSVGNVLHAASDYEGALALQLEALEHYRSVFGRQHSQVATMLSNIGAVYTMLGRTDDARRYLEDAAAMLESLYGPRHPMLGSVWLNLGAVLQVGGNVEEAHAQYLRAKNVFDASYPAGHPRILKAMVGLAQTEKLFQPQRAEQRFEEVLAVIRAQKDPNLRVMAASYGSLGHTQYQKAQSLRLEGKEDAALLELHKASENYTAALETLERQDEGARSAQQVMLVYLNFCLLEHERKDFERASKLCRTAWDTERSRGTVGVYGVEAAVSLAVSLAEQQRPKEAVSFLQEALSEIPKPLSTPVRLQRATLLWETPSSRQDVLDELREFHRLVEDELSDEDRQALDVWLREHQR